MDYPRCVDELRTGLLPVAIGLVALRVAVVGNGDGCSIRSKAEASPYGYGWWLLGQLTLGWG